MKALICIVCPKGCHLNVDETNGYSVTGNQCKKGAEYGRDELLHPMRVVTSTVKADRGIFPRCPVKTDHAVPKEKTFAVMEALNRVQLTCPVECGQIVIKNIAGTGTNLIATRTLPRRK